MTKEPDTGEALPETHVAVIEQEGDLSTQVYEDTHDEETGAHTRRAVFEEGEGKDPEGLTTERSLKEARAAGVAAAGGVEAGGEELPRTHAELDAMAEEQGVEWSRSGLNVSEKQAELSA